MLHAPILLVSDEFVGKQNKPNDIAASNKRLSVITAGHIIGLQQDQTAVSALWCLSVYQCGWWFTAVSVMGLDRSSAVSLSHGHQLLLRPVYPHTPTHFALISSQPFHIFYFEWQIPVSKGFDQCRNFVPFLDDRK